MLLCRGPLKGQQEHADVFIKEADCIAGIFAEFFPNQFRFAVPQEVVVLGFKKCTSHQFHLIIHVCPTASFRCLFFSSSLGRQYAVTGVFIRRTIRVLSGLPSVLTDPQLATWATPKELEHAKLFRVLNV